MALFIVLILIFLIKGLYMWRKNKILIFKTNTGNSLYVQYGNVLDKDILDGQNNVVIPINRCFDTIVDNDLISERTLHGAFMKLLYKTKKYNENSLNCDLQQELKREYSGLSEKLNIKDKRKGNLDRYPIGTIVELKVNDKKIFLLGLSKFDNKLKASTSLEEFVIAVQKLVEFCEVRSQGFPVFIPVFGTGLSRVNISKQEALKYLVNAFTMNKNRIHCDIHIVVFSSDKKDVSLYNI